MSLLERIFAFASSSLVGSLVLISALSAPALAAEDEIPIYPTWKLMDDQAKRQFVAGYLFGHREARALGEVVIDYLRENPKATPEQLEAVLSHYRVSPLSANQLVPLLNKQFEDQENRSISMRRLINQINKSSR